MIVKIMLVSALVVVAAGVAGLANSGIGALIDSPNGSFQDHLDTGLKIIAGISVAMMAMIGAITLVKELWPK